MCSLNLINNEQKENNNKNNIRQKNLKYAFGDESSKAEDRSGH